MTLINSAKVGTTPIPLAAAADSLADPGLAAHGRSVAIHTHGCKLNQADSEVLGRRFAEAGYRVVDWRAGADVLVLNTCTVTGAADAKARQALQSARRANPGAVIVATGCYAQRAADQLALLEEVSLVVGNTKKDQLVSAVTAVIAKSTDDRPTHANRSTEAVLAGFGQSSPATLAQPKERHTGRSRAMIKIQEGCDQVCAYCIVPKVRGREKSIPEETILWEINNRVGQGCQEVVLTGTQLGTYGHDLAGSSLSTLLRRILIESSVIRLRVSSLQPQEITEELLELWHDPRLCPHFHVPLQSGSNRILKSMRRRYDSAQFARTVELIRQRMPDAAITTDLIVGFPGEDESEFQESRRLASSMQFSDMHVFPFSPRPGTSAAHFSNQVPEQAKKARAAEMAEVAKKGFRAFRLQQLGTTRPVLWEKAGGAGAPTLWSGLTDNYIRVSAEGRRELRNVVTEARLMKLIGDCVSSVTA